MQEDVPVFVTADTLVDTYISRPVRIKAVQWDGTEEAALGLCAWADSHQGSGSTVYLPAEEARATDMSGDTVRPARGPRVVVGTLEGNLELQPGSWLIQGTEGEFYPCKDTVFQRKYAVPVNPQDGAALVDSSRLMSTTDAAVWAAEFAKVHPEMDEGFMIGWFASAIETAKMITKANG